MSEFKVNSYTTNNQRNPDVVTLTNGGFIVVWVSDDGSSYSTDGSVNDPNLHYQAFDINGNVIGDERVISDSLINSEYSVSSYTPYIWPGLSGRYANEERFLVTHEIGGSSRNSILLGSWLTDNLWLNELGNVLQKKIGIGFSPGTRYDTTSSDPKVASFEQGGFVTVGFSPKYSTAATGSQARYYELDFRIYDANETDIGGGLLHSGFFKISEDFSFNIATLSNGNFIVTYNAVGIGSQSTRAQVFNSSGVEIGTEINLAGGWRDPFDGSIGPNVTSLANGGFVVTWTEWIQKSRGALKSYEIIAQVFDDNGIAISDWFYVNNYDYGHQGSPDVIGLSDGGFVIVWETAGQIDSSGNLDTDGYSIFSKIYEANGDSRNDEFQVNAYTDDWQGDPSVTALNNGGFVVTWESENQEGSDGYDIFAKIYNANGVAISSDAEAAQSSSNTLDSTDDSPSSTVNAAPADITLTNTSVNENSSGAVVGTLSVTDLDIGDSHTLVLSGADADQFEIVSSGLKLRSGIEADYETKASYSVTVTATDIGGLTFDQAFIIIVSEAYESTVLPSGSTFNGNTYQLVTTGASYASAKIAAVDAGGYLVIINSQAENDFVYGLLNDANITTTATDGGSAQYAWLGATDEVVEGDWRWVDGTSLTYSNWGSGYYPDGSYNTEPDNTIAAEAGAPNGQDYAAMGMESWPSGYDFSLGQPGQWNDVAGSNTLAYVIEISNTATEDNITPTNITLSNISVDENSSGAVVGTLSVTDSDIDDSHTLALSGTDGEQFEIVSNQLKLRSGIEADYETKSSYAVTITATDSGGLTYSQNFSLGVSQSTSNSAPTSITLNSTWVSQNSAGILVGTLSVTDSDIDDSHTLALSGTDGEQFEIVSNQLKLRSGIEADYETKSSYAITLTATDSGGLTYSQNFSIYVSQYTENRAPTGITIDNTSINENSAGAVVGTLNVADANDLYGHSLTVDNGAYWYMFEIVDEQLKLKSDYSANYEWKNSYSLTVKAKDIGGLSYTQDFTISVIDDVTESSDYTAPDIQTQETLYIASSDNIVFEFDELIARGTGEIELRTMDVTDYEFLDNIPIAVEIDGNKLVINPEIDLDVNRDKAIYEYQVVIYSDAILDLSGNDFNYYDGSVFGDDGGIFGSKGIPFTVWFPGGTPTDISLDGSTIAENAEGSQHIANITGTEPDGDDLTYYINGGADASMFELVGSMLHLATGVSLDYEAKPQLVVELRAANSNLRYYDEEFTIDVIEFDEKSLPLTGTLGRDKFNGFSGTSTIDAGGGVDDVAYLIPRAQVNFSLNTNDQLFIQDSSGQSEILTSVERIQFTDSVYALDVAGNAGLAAKVIIATFGTDSLSSYMSAALSVVDAGTTLEGLCDLVVDLKLIDQVSGSSSNESFVGQVFQNVVGRSPNLLESSLYTSYLDNGTYTKSSLLTLAASTALTANLVTAKTVDLIGVPGSSDGELLAIQYDLGLV